MLAPPDAPYKSLFTPPVDGPSMTDYTAAVVGTGNMGARHGAAYAAREDCELVACADLDVERAAAYAADAGLSDERVFEDYREMLATVDPDLVSVATPIPTHADVVVGCLRAGDPAAIHCEKPMASAWGDCRLMAQEAARRDVQLTFNHQLRCSEPVREASALLEGGAIGDLRRVEASRADVFEAGIHQLDLCSHFAGDVPAEWVLGGIDYREREIRNGVDIEDGALAQWRYENGVHGLAATGTGADAIGCHNRLLGTDGEIEITFFGDAPVRVRRDGEGWEEIDCGMGQPLQAAVDHVVDSLSTGTEPVLSAHNALVATEIVFALWGSVRRRGRVDLPLRIDDNPLLAMLDSGDLNPAEPDAE
jgi:predicted dehydrogenase